MQIISPTDETMRKYARKWRQSTECTQSENPQEWTLDVSSKETKNFKYYQQTINLTMVIETDSVTYEMQRVQPGSNPG